MCSGCLPSLYSSWSLESLQTMLRETTFGIVYNFLDLAVYVIVSSPSPDFRKSLDTIAVTLLIIRCLFVCRTGEWALVGRDSVGMFRPPTPNNTNRFVEGPSVSLLCYFSCISPGTCATAVLSWSMEM